MKLYKRSIDAYLCGSKSLTLWNRLLQCRQSIEWQTMFPCSSELPVLIPATLSTHWLTGTRFLAKALGVEHGVTPCFMAKPIQGLPGNSGHIHVSLNDLEGNNLFARQSRDEQAPWDDVAHLSDMGRQFLAGLIDALPDIMPLFAPNINSYKRLVENFWAPVTVSWGLEDRSSSIRLIAPPTCKPGATRFEVRIPGADIHPHYALTAIFRAGLRGIERKMKIELPPLSRSPKGRPAAKLPNTLERAVDRFQAQDSVARQIMRNEFVDFYTISRKHELAVWREAVTDW